ncbi:hypothetical protein AGMMS49543_17410 [Betaproteobacteria bacterium]|nr:hypothetical protein AGMMS49543_17410 [Betaproteobacteria bacterium]GHU21616.1 hypothetical protein AGMMS50243_19650 [Betaproteobacteria bacterium]
MQTSTSNSDAVFQVSLSEIAFTLVFILLILLGWMYFHADEERREALARFDALNTQTLRPYEQEAYEQARQALASQLATRGVDADAVIERLVDSAKAAAHTAALQTRVEDLEAQLSTLTEVKAVMEKAGRAMAQTATEDVLSSALELRARLEQKILDPAGQSPRGARQLSDLELETRLGSAVELRQQLDHAFAELGLSIAPGHETEWARRLVDAHVNKTGDERETADLRGQIVFLRGRLEARGGRDYPPCWADEQSGRVQFLFTVELHPESITLTPSWPPAREQDARALPGIDDLLGKSPHSYAGFRERVQGIFQRSNARQCRHYIQLRSRITDAASSDRARLMVESFFYKMELAR